ncbi:hypothetical protein DID80_01610 [Candidatus Marinamargulisbacteria bacterium SCGC AAA071-K20]|nr:hypothetical protein DID80_01610 [Candidatus Marinamargulisbacteria bacterium SCGC AAA071-K20]
MRANKKLLPEGEENNKKSKYSKQLGNTYGEDQKVEVVDASCMMAELLVEKYINEELKHEKD